MSWGDDPVVAAPAAPAKGGYGTDPVVPENTQSWGDVGEQAVQNFLPSAQKAGEAIIAPITDPKGTAEGIGRLWKSLMSFGMDPDMAGAVARAGPETEKAFKESYEANKAEQRGPVDAVGKYYTERYGSMEGFKKALAEDPVGVAMDIGTLGAGGAGAGGRVGALIKPLRAVDPVNIVSKAIKGGAKAAETMGSEALGHLTGGGPEAIREAVKAGFEKQTKFLDALFGEIPMEESVKLASKGISNMKKQRNENYQTLMKTLKASPEEISFDKIKQARVEFEDRGRFKGIPIYETTPAVRAKVDGILDAWEKLPKDEFHTLEGFDTLKKKLGSVLDNIPFDAKTDRSYVAGIKRAVSDSIEQQAPIYGKVMKDYHQASDALEEIEKSLSLGDRSTYDSGVRKLLSAMRNNANTNYGNRLKMVDALEKSGAKGLKAQLAGSQMSSAMPRGLAGGNPMKTLLASMFEPGALGLLPFESPKLVGQGLYKGGRVAGEMSDALKSTILPDASTMPGKALRSTSPEWLARILRQMGTPTQ